MNDQKALLTPSQIETYWRDGYLLIEDVISPDQLAKLRQAEAEPTLQASLHDRGHAERTVHLLELTTRHPAFLELCRCEAILGRIRPLLGPNIHLQHSKLATKPTTKGKGPFGWHQDFAFYPHTNTSLLSVFVYLDDTNLENGAMSMVRGSHRLGLLDHTDAEGYFTTVCQERRHWEANPEAVQPLCCRAGAISIHHCLTLHGSPENSSGRPRRGLVFSYRATDAHQLADTIFQDTGLLVSGQTSTTVRCESANWRLPLRRTPEHPWGPAHHQTGAWALQQNDQSST